MLILTIFLQSRLVNRVPLKAKQGSGSYSMISTIGPNIWVLLTTKVATLPIRRTKPLQPICPATPRVNWVKLSAVRKFLSIAETTQRREPAQLVVGGKYRW